jgi:hypothetical protein
MCEQLSPTSPSLIIRPPRLLLPSSLPLLLSLLMLMPFVASLRLELLKGDFGLTTTAAVASVAGEFFCGDLAELLLSLSAVVAFVSPFFCSLFFSSLFLRAFLLAQQHPNILIFLSQLAKNDGYCPKSRYFFKMMCFADLIYLYIIALVRKTQQFVYSYHD